MLCCQFSQLSFIWILPTAVLIKVRIHFVGMSSRSSYTNNLSPFLTEVVPVDRIGGDMNKVTNMSNSLERWIILFLSTIVYCPFSNEETFIPWMEVLTRSFPFGTILVEYLVTLCLFFCCQCCQAAESLTFLLKSGLLRQNAWGVWQSPLFRIICFQCCQAAESICIVPFKSVIWFHLIQILFHA